LCSLNPLAAYALRELNRCVDSKRFVGLKLHLQMSDVDLGVRDHVEKVKAVFAAADRLQFAIVVHAQTRGAYTRQAAKVFVDELLAAAPHIPVTIAHLWGGGGFAAEPLAVYVEAAGQPVGKNLYFDVAEAALVANGDKQIQQAIADAIRHIGPQRILFGSDAVGSSTLAPAKAAAQFRNDIPLSQAEFDTIAGNVAPYLKGR
jgi:predicted TIM-barrel fold metal-dependent hydrolase